LAAGGVLPSKFLPGNDARDSGRRQDLGRPARPSRGSGLLSQQWTDAIPYERANGGSDPAKGPVEFANAHEGWLAVGPNRLFRTADGGHSWSDLAIP
jgi:hypothetical protein